MKACCEQFLSEQFPGDPVVVCEIYAEYASSLREKLGDLEKGAAESDWTALDRCAHAVKGNALAVGDQETADAAIELRGAAKQGDGTRVKAIIGRLRDLAGQL